jgi:ABC-type Zn uptake system ZnuABC Zn-binding protein ZnuA
VYSDALSAKNGPAGSYIAMLRHNTALFAAAMAKE